MLYEVITVYSVAMLVMAVVFWFFTYPDPKHEQRKQKKRNNFV